MFFAIPLLIAISFPDTLMYKGPLNGASNFSLTLLPGKHPISRSLSVSASDANPLISPISPIFKSATVFDTLCLI